ncbi:D-Ala-D-Ala carboxypeptidase family metallohydrolase [Verrucomicrobium spinosum]|uniref:D-Ala-D-Ala carboxypeptidase family metallohydrolase n=1 Tax=Verrucomicrobium spinosum TaxID=2736 RepID=UPI0001744627|nr:D-Ala-D-Ala carboxypeptidase family metallohydrolase [Verrucomicrobium spinosum]
MKTEWSVDQGWGLVGMGVAAAATLALLLAFAGIIAPVTHRNDSRASDRADDDEFSRMLAELDSVRPKVSSPVLQVPPPKPQTTSSNDPLTTVPEPQPVAAVKISTPQNDPATHPAPVIEPVLFPALTAAEIAEAAEVQPAPGPAEVKPPVVSPETMPEPMADPVAENEAVVAMNPVVAGMPQAAPAVVTRQDPPPAPLLVEGGKHGTLTGGAVPQDLVAMMPKESHEPLRSPRTQMADGPLAPVEEVEDCNKMWSGKPEELVSIRKKAGLHPAGFSIAFRGLVNPYPLMSTLCMPGETVEIKVVAPRGKGDFVVKAEGGTASPKGNELLVWNWVVPETPGLYCLQITNRDTGGMMCLHGLVCVPYRGEERLEGYQIGQYQKTPLNNNLRYAMPLGLFRVTREMEDTWLTPHFQLRQFMCKQVSTYPKFVLLESSLLLKLEALVEGLEKRGIKEGSIFVASGYRTPAYNKALGNTTVYSRHLYGDAADILVDQDRDARLDDLNKDGKVDAKDTVWLTKLVAEVSSSFPAAFEGGLGLYPFKSPATAFIHTDTRGEPTRWGFPQANNRLRPGPKRLLQPCDDGCGHEHQVSVLMADLSGWRVPLARPAGAGSIFHPASGAFAIPH